MKKKNYLSLLVTLTALGVAGGMHVPTLQAGGGDGADKSLLPVVFLTLDTSGSMSQPFGSDNNTRMTQALQELTGTVKRNDECPRSVASHTRYPRKQLTCNKLENKCEYKTVWYCDAKHNYEVVKTEGNTYWHQSLSSYGKCDIYANSGLYNDYFVRNLIDGFQGDEASFAASYVNDGIIHKYMNTVKFGFATMYCSYGDNSWRYGSHTTNVSGFSNGDVDSNNEAINYTYGFSSFSSSSFRSDRSTWICTGTGGGMWGSDIEGPTPLQYPTTSDDPMDVRASNEAVVYNVRTFNLSGGNTPLGDMIEDIALMFNNGGQIDPALITQPKPNGKYNEPVTDTAWRCRPKGVIAMTDGEPNTPVSSSNAAYQLYLQNVKVYAVAYAQNSDNLRPSTDINSSSVASVMSKIAWKGGTCREFGHTGEVIHPTDEDGYKKYLNNVNNKPAEYQTCFYNAYSGIALRSAMQSIMNELLQGYTSKSKMVTTTAVGKKTTLDGAGKPTNGWYNVYSGYQVNLGSMRNSGLQREAYVCREGEFRYDKNLYLDLAKKLDDRLRKCRARSIFDATSSGPVGDCIENRAIFVGDYSEKDDAFNKGRYALKPDRIHFSDKNAGVIHYMTSDSTTGTPDATYHFFAYNNDYLADYRDTVQSELTDTSKNELVTNYIVSPYECVTEVDCICTSNSKRIDCVSSDDADTQYICDQGKCVLQSTMVSLTSCTGSVAACEPSGGVCVGGQCRPLAGGNCIKHSDCMSGSAFGSADFATQNQVCHGGKCVNGVLVRGDIRDMVASIPLGAIEYASPVIVGPPAYSYRGADYVTFKNKYADRDTMMYVPANDGMLHAFILGKNNSNTYSSSMFRGLRSPQLDASSEADIEGHELWAFIPKSVMKDLHSLTDFGEQKKINVAPVFADVQFPDGEGGGEWHSVIVGGFREGGRGYYALDVTKPDDPQILWEIDHQWQSVESDAPYGEFDNDIAVSSGQEMLLKRDNLYPFIRMGYSYPEAIITNVIIDNEIVPVAVLAGGVASGNDTTDCNAAGKCAPDVTGKAVFVVRLNPSSKEDLLVREFQFDTRISGTPAAFPAGFNSIARVLYVGDENGALHRIDVSDPDMNNWKINGLSVVTHNKVAKVAGELKPIFDPNNISVLQGTPRKTYEKITYKPAVSALTSTGFPDIQIVFGTGDSSNTSIDTQDLNYTAVFIDHYVNQEVGYRLNNFNIDLERDAITRNLNPLVIVFNPTHGIVHRDLHSYPTPSGNQYFEVWAGEVVSSSKPAAGETDTPEYDFCNTCTKEECYNSYSCAECDYCSCVFAQDGCESTYAACKACENEYNTCINDAEDDYKDCLDDVALNCSNCETENTNLCEKKCEQTCDSAYKVCYNYAETTCKTVANNYFCDWFGSRKVLGTPIRDIGIFSWFFNGPCDWLVSRVRSFILEPRQKCSGWPWHWGNCLRNALKDILSAIDSIFTKKNTECITSEQKKCETTKINCYDTCETNCADTGIDCEDVCSETCTKTTCTNNCGTCTPCGECAHDSSGGSGSGDSGSGDSGSGGSGSSGSGTGSTATTDNIRAAQKMMGPALTYNFRSYFPTYNAVYEEEDACNDGFASIWMLDDRVLTGPGSDVRTWAKKSVVQNGLNNVNGVSGSTDNGKAATSFATGHFINLANGTKVYGLAMTPQAICIDDDKAQVVAPQLIAQTGKVPGVSGASEAAANDFTGTGRDLPQTGEATDIKVLSITEDALSPESNVLSWASVYE